MPILVTPALAPSALAQSGQEQPASGPGALRRVALSCKAETARYCTPQRDMAAPDPRSQLICLRPYRTSLSLGCRSAVNAMTSR